jgi:phosphatidylinositol alpha-1,6-mannosyltransferase
VPPLGRALRSLSSPVLGRMTSPKYAGLLEYGGSYEGAYLLRRALYMPWELKDILEPALLAQGLGELDLMRRLAASREGIEGEQAIVASLECAWYMRNQLLRDADWAGMAHSMEIRVPFVDLDVFRTVAGFFDSPHAFTKRDVAEATQPSLPRQLRNRRKTGFSVPVQHWTRAIAHAGERGLRGWAKKVNPAPLRKSRVIAFVSDAFGGHGGIAKFNRDLLGALAGMPECEAVLALPRIVTGELEAIPPKVAFEIRAARGKVAFVTTAIRTALGFGRADLVVCGHINLLPVAALVGFIRRAPTLLVLHGIEAWKPTDSPVCNALARRVDAAAAVSNTTLHRFQQWARFPDERAHILPNCVDLSRYGPGAKPADLVQHLGLDRRVTLLTVGRLSEFERYKGFDEVIEALAGLRTSHPDLTYLIAGDGPDRARLEQKVEALGMEGQVKFLGFIPEERKADYYRLADAYVMPSRGEGFGIVYLEALACGVPVLGSKIDGSRDALQDGELGTLVDPSKPAEVAEGILRTLRQPRGVPEKLAYYSSEMFARRVHTLVRNVCATGM